MTRPHSEHDAGESLAALAAEARRDLDRLAHPAGEWVKPLDIDGRLIDDVLIVGGGQSGVVIAAALKREGVQRVTVVDSAGPGDEGPWTTFARMSELRTPKSLVGHELGLPSLSLRRWYETRFSPEAWEAIDRVPRTAWKDYLDWLASTTGVAIEHNTSVHDVRKASIPALNGSSDRLLTIETKHRGSPQTRHARAVVMATGFDGAGSWTVPDFIVDALPEDRYHHSNIPFDLGRLAGRRVGILGHGASAFDNANAAIESGAASVELCFRRKRLPRVNPHRFLETAGAMAHFADLSDSTKWQVARHFRMFDQPPPVATFQKAIDQPKIRIRPDTNWLSVRLAGDEVVIATPRGELTVDYLIPATGATADLAARPELTSLAPIVARWSDRYSPPEGDEDPHLAALPYLDGDYSFIPVSSDTADSWVGRVFAFNFGSAVSHAPHSTSISGHKHAVPRLVRGVTRRLMLDMESELLPDLRAYVSDDLAADDDFEEQLLSAQEVPQ